jgi:uncharacterized protein YjiS (DUF1127 family)
MHTMVDTERPPGRASAPERRGSTAIGSRSASLLRHMLAWLERARGRRALLALDDWVLKDIGLTRADVMHETDKPFWQE